MCAVKREEANSKSHEDRRLESFYTLPLGSDIKLGLLEKKMYYVFPRITIIN